jgi:DNA-binding MarR family transcriptional regulator
MTSSVKGASPDSAYAVTNAMREASALGILYSATVARHLGISSSDLECLDFVASNQPVTAGALATATGLTTGAITGVIDRLEKAGFVIRLVSEEDRRKVLVGTTDAFRKRVVPLFEPMHRLQTEVISRYSDKQLKLVAKFMASSLEAARAAVVEVSNKKK